MSLRHLSEPFRSSSREINELLKSSRLVIGAAYIMLTNAQLCGWLPTPVAEIYPVAQNALGVSPEYCSSDAWFKIEDGMVIALARAVLARFVLLMLTGRESWPMVEAYGNCSMECGAQSTHLQHLQTLQGTHGIDLFYQMKLQHINPSFITYGAIIGACARWVMSRVQRRFAEMEASRDLKQRVPPYNMMQLYTMTKHDRERAFYYQKEDERKPDCAYKVPFLTMDVYGALEFDINSTEQEFLSLQRDIHVPILGTDFFSYQCIRIVKDLTKLPSNFDSLSIPVTPAPNLVMRWYTRL
ncbi:hypothetical protein JOM56_014438 [Amanita muscaria]